MDEALPPAAPIQLPIHEVVDVSRAATAREQVERVLHLAELSSPDELEALLQHLPVGITIAEAPSGRIVACNPAGREILAVTPFAAPPEEPGREVQGFHTDGRPLLPHEWPLTRAIRHGEVVEGEEMEVRGPGGERRFFRISAAPIRNLDGRITFGVATIHDVTEGRRHLERERFLSQASDILSASLDYRTTVQRLAGLCVRSLAQYCLVHVEHKGEVRALGIASSGPVPEEEARELLRLFPVDPQSSHPVAEALRSGTSQLLSELSDDRLPGGASGPDRLRLLQVTGVASALVVPLRAQGRTLGSITVARTASLPAYGPGDLELMEALASRAAHAVDNARLYREAQQAVQAREETMSVVSHDLRNSLHAALLNVELVLDVDPAFDRESHTWRRIKAVRRSLQHMHHLVQDLLEVDRLGRGKLSIRSEPLNVRRLAMEVGETLGPLARDAGVRLEVRIPDPALAVMADSARLVQVLNNLITNALHATPADGRVEIAVEPQCADWVQFRVSDTGAGMSEEELGRIFDRFFQGGAGRRTGVGLGLTIARGIVEAHGGRIWAESQPGRGSTFSFTVPRAPA